MRPRNPPVTQRKTHAIANKTNGPTKPPPAVRKSVRKVEKPVVEQRPVVHTDSEVSFNLSFIPIYSSVT